MKAQDGDAPVFQIYGLFSNGLALNADAGTNLNYEYAAAGYPAFYNSFFRPGYAAGITFRIAEAGKVVFNVDFRGADMGVFSTKVPTGLHHDFGYGFGGIQVTTANRFGRVRPYGQLSVGGFGTHTQGHRHPDATYVKDYHGVELFAGADYRISKHWDWRLAEVGYGFGWANNQDDPPVKGITAFHISTGAVLDF